MDCVTPSVRNAAGGVCEGHMIEVLWAIDGKYHAAIIREVLQVGVVRIEYADGLKDAKNLSTEKWRFCQENVQRTWGCELEDGTSAVPHMDGTMLLASEDTGLAGSGLDAGIGLGDFQPAGDCDIAAFMASARVAAMQDGVVHAPCTVPQLPEAAPVLAAATVPAMVSGFDGDAGDSGVEMFVGSTFPTGTPALSQGTAPTTPGDADEGTEVSDGDLNGDEFVMPSIGSSCVSPLHSRNVAVATEGCGCVAETDLGVENSAVEAVRAGGLHGCSTPPPMVDGNAKSGTMKDRSGTEGESEGIECRTTASACETARDSKTQEISLPADISRAEEGAKDKSGQSSGLKLCTAPAILEPLHIAAAHPQTAPVSTKPMSNEQAEDAKTSAEQALAPASPQAPHMPSDSTPTTPGAEELCVSDGDTQASGACERGENADDGVMQDISKLHTDVQTGENDEMEGVQKTAKGSGGMSLNASGETKRRRGRAKRKQGVERECGMKMVERRITRSGSCKRSQTAAVIPRAKRARVAEKSMKEIWKSVSADEVRVDDVIEVFWPLDEKFYRGVVRKMLRKGRVRIDYEDGEREMLELGKETYRVLRGGAKVEGVARGNGGRGKVGVKR